MYNRVMPTNNYAAEDTEMGQETEEITFSVTVPKKVADWIARVGKGLNMSRAVFARQILVDWEHNLNPKTRQAVELLEEALKEQGHGKNSRK